MLEELKARADEQGMQTLSVDERIILTTTGNLLKCFRGLEVAGIIKEDDAARLIGSVKRLAAVACLAANNNGKKQTTTEPSRSTP